MRSCPEVKSVLGSHTLSLIAIGCIVFLILCPFPTTGIKVLGSIYTGTIAPGSSAVHTMTISTQPDDSPMDLSVDVLGLGQSGQQSNTGLSAEMDKSPYSARTFITVSPQTFHLDAGGSQEVKATIAVPQNVGDGGRYAILTIRNAPVGNGSTAIVTAISVPVVVTIADSALTLKGTITDVTVADVIPGQPIRITSALKNTGNFHYKVKNNVSVTDSAGKVVAEGGSGLSSRSIVPTFMQNYEVNVDTPLPPGTYTASSKVSLDDGTVLDTKPTSFEVPANYIPPLQGASTRLTARSSAVLPSPDGRVTINFPAGAVFSDTDVSMKPLAKDQAPAPSPGMAPASTFFKVDGINGLLAKDATLIVKYTSADLEAAKSDVSKLALARYDDADNKWTILPTTLDKSALTLSTATNRLGTLGVMVSSGGNTQGSTQGSASSTAAGGSKPGIGLDPTIVFGALGIMIVFVGIYRSRKH
jgi:methionine-rich copper-binding protein CopC